MKKFTFFLSLLCLICMGATAQTPITSNPAQDKTYTIRTYHHPDHTDRGWWKSNNESTEIVGTTTESEAGQFAFINYQSKLYIYSVAAKKFVASSMSPDGVNTVNNRASLVDTDLSLISEVTFHESSGEGAESNPAYLTDQNNFYFNMGSQHNLFINSWRSLDDGNKLAIIEAAEFSADALAEATAILDAYFNNLVTITYNIQENGTTIATQSYEVQKGEAYPTIADNNSYNSYTGYPEGTVEQAGTYNIAYTGNYPFVISESFENAKWYSLTIHADKYYLSHTDGQTAMPLSRRTTEFNDNDLWCFVGNGVTGFTVYNKAAGKDMILSSSKTMSGENGSTTYPILTATPVPEGNNTLWKVTPGNTIGAVQGFYLGQAETGYRVNKRGGNLAYWSNGADGGSTLLASTEEEAIAALANAYEKALPYAGCVGTLTTAQVNELKTKTSYKEATAFAEANTVKIDPAKYYTFESAYPGFTDGQVRVLTAGTDNLTWKVADKKNVNAIWKIQKGTEDGKYALQAVNSEKYAGEGVFNSPFAYSETPSDYYFTKATDAAYNAAVFHIQRDNNANALTTMAMDGAAPSSATATEGTIKSWNSTASSCASSWVIREVNEIEVAMNTVNGESWASLYLPFGVQLAEGVEAYIVTGQDGNGEPIVYLESIENIPANTGVVLKGTAENYTLTIDNTVQAIGGINFLKGFNVETSVTDMMYDEDYEEWTPAQMVWVFGCRNNQVGFYYPKNNKDEATGISTVTLKANKAFLDLYEMIGNEPMYIAISFGKGDATGIQSTPADRNEQDNIFYDLSGRRVQAPAKGIYVTGNGKKIYVK